MAAGTPYQAQGRASVVPRPILVSVSAVKLERCEFTLSKIGQGPSESVDQEAGEGCVNSCDGGSLLQAGQLKWRPLTPYWSTRLASYSSYIATPNGQKSF